MTNRNINRYLILLVLLVLSANFCFAHELVDLVHIPSNDKTHEFYIGKYPVTNSDYKAFTDSTNTKTPKYWRNGTYPNDKANHPVVFVSYNDAIAYCSWLETKHPEYTFRLPMVEEWEYVANGGNEYAFPLGKALDENCFNYNKIVATAYLEENPTVTYINPKSSKYGQSLPLNKVISINGKNGISGWIDHKNNAGFVYTDLFNKIMENGGFTTHVNQYSNGKSPFGVYDMSGFAYKSKTTKLLSLPNYS